MKSRQPAAEEGWSALLTAHLTSGLWAAGQVDLTDLYQRQQENMELQDTKEYNA